VFRDSCLELQAQPPRRVHQLARDVQRLRVSHRRLVSSCHLEATSQVSQSVHGLIDTTFMTLAYPQRSGEIVLILLYPQTKQS
jgi:hypothetical protein